MNMKTAPGARLIDGKLAATRLRAGIGQEVKDLKARRGEVPGLAVVLVGSALLDGSGAAIGHFGILSALTEADARAFAEGDPYAVGGAVETIELTPLPDTFQAHRIAEPMTVSG